MTQRIAIHPDRVIQNTGDVQSFSDRWQRRAAMYDIQTELIDAYDPTALDMIRNYDAFMWRFPPDVPVCRFAQSFFNAVEFGLEKPVFPNWRTHWHLEDKIAQTYLLQSLGIPMPETAIFWDRETAERYLSNARFPLVLKLASGFRSRNVRLLNDLSEAEYFVKQLFDRGITSLVYSPAGRIKSFARDLRLARRILRGGRVLAEGQDNEIHHGYFYIQEFVAGNDHDTRVVIIGDRAFAFVRNNRPDDFRASGSGLRDWDTEKVDLRIVEKAFEVCDCLQAQTVAIDAIWRDNEIVILEISYGYSTSGIRHCPGHWRRYPEKEARMEWVEGAMNPEDAIFDDFVSEHLKQ
jgi:glutathione synthase/RimK-type ligase-like ATP-grasp enzyme